MNRFAWDLRYDDPIQSPGAFYSGTGPNGPLALPGDDQVLLTVVGKSQTVTLQLAIEAGDAEPTKPQLDVFQTLSSQLEDQLKKWAQLKNEDVPKVSELIKQANLPALIITEKKKSE